MRRGCGRQVQGSSCHCKIVGDFFSEGDLRVDGTVEGNIETAGKVVVGKEGVIDLNCNKILFD